MAIRLPVLHAFASRDFRLLWSGQTVSLIGDAAFFVALGWTTFKLEGSGVLVGVLAVLDFGGGLSIELLATIALLQGVAGGFFMPAFGGIVPLVVEQPPLASANALIGISRQVSLIIGPAFAGLAYGATGSATVFAFDAGSFVFSAALGWLARPRPRRPAGREGAPRASGAR